MLFHPATDQITPSILLFVRTGNKHKDILRRNMHIRLLQQKSLQLLLRIEV